jgi:flagellar basal-body rod modification protein FlgD
MDMGNTNAISNAVSQGASLNPGSSGTSAAKDDKPSTDPQFGDVLNKIQSQYGAKTDKPREIKKTLGKDDFLKIMITQMQHQDPTNPFKAEQMAQEMAQFTSVEQMQNMNQSLKQMAQQHNPLEKLAMTSMIGKTVTVDRARFPHTQGQNEALSFNLPRDAKNVQVAIINESGEVVLEKELGPQKQGENTFAWDGLKGNRLPAKGGNYMFRLEAKDASEHEIDTGSEHQARVIGVSFEGEEPVLLVGDAKQQSKVAMKSVVRIDGEGAEAALPQKSAPGNNFFSFQKGVGSQALDPMSMSKDVASAIDKAEHGDAKPAQNSPQTQAPAGQNPPQNGAEKGFPNGLQ